MSYFALEYFNSLLPFGNTYKIENAIASVLVLIPPPVEPGDAPTHIKKSISIIVGTVSTEISTVLNPAVRVVTELKKAVTIFPN